MTPMEGKTIATSIQKFRGMNKRFELSAIFDHIGQTQFSGH